MVVVTGEKRTQATAKAARIAAPAPPPADPGARLRSAAALGRAADVEALLARGVAVDAPDADGETALMKAIRADKPAVAALLRRHGASLDHANHAGVSGWELAAMSNDPELARALQLEP
jgi:ankyrin repeat protein